MTDLLSDRMTLIEQRERCIAAQCEIKRVFNVTSNPEVRTKLAQAMLSITQAMTFIPTVVHTKHGDEVHCSPIDNRDPGDVS